jgi:23S rRNA (guanine745-N1)-methyltransferase
VAGAVPEALAAVSASLRCPNCSQPLAAAESALGCSSGHSFDVARDGHVTLTDPRRRPATGDDAEMVASRATVLDAGHFAPLAGALVQAAPQTARLVLDVGAGTGHYLAAVLDALPAARGIAADASRPALRRAARANPRIAAIACDVWQRLPLQDATADLALNVFAPRNPAELARVLRPGAMLLVATAAPGHLHELAALHGVRVDPRKDERLKEQFEPLLVPAATQRIEWTLRLTRDEAAAAVRMGPAARHMTPEIERRLAALPEPFMASAAVALHIFRAG